MSTRRFAAPASLGGAALIILAVLATVLLWFQTGETEGEAPTVDTCEGVDFVSAAPDRTDLAFGPDVRQEITDFDQLSNNGQVEAVLAHQLATWCKFPAIALANAMHRGIVPWPSSPDEWLAQLKVLVEDREKHHDLVEKMLKWESDHVQKYEIVYNHDKYLSDWFDRSSGQPVLTRGDGHAVEANWVIRRTLKDGSVLDERLVCSYQLAGPVPPLTPPPPGTTPPPPVTTAPPPPTTSGGKDATKRPPQNPVVTCPSGQFADRDTGQCIPYSATTTTVYDNSGGDSGPGAPGPGVSTPTTDPAPDPTVPTNTGPGDGSIPDPGV